MGDPPSDAGGLKATPAWALPAVAVPMVGAPGTAAVFVSVKVTTGSPRAEAVTVKAPAIPLAVITGLVATPVEPVLTVAVANPLKSAPAPLLPGTSVYNTGTFPSRMVLGVGITLSLRVDLSTANGPVLKSTLKDNVIPTP